MSIVRGGRVTDDQRRCLDQHLRFDIILQMSERSTEFLVDGLRGCHQSSECVMSESTDLDGSDSHREIIIENELHESLVEVDVDDPRIHEGWRES